jgi:hypothetical protein
MNQNSGSPQSSKPSAARLLWVALSGLAFLAALLFYGTRGPVRVPARAELQKVTGILRYNTYSGDPIEDKLELFLENDPTVYQLSANSLALGRSADAIMAGGERRLELLVSGAGPVKQVWQMSINESITVSYEVLAAGRKLDLPGSPLPLIACVITFAVFVAALFVWLRSRSPSAARS